MTQKTTKRLLSVLCLCLVMLLALSACSSGEQSGVQQSSGQSNGQSNGQQEENEIPIATGPLPTMDVQIPNEPPTPPATKPNLDFSSNPTMDGINTDFAYNYEEMFTNRDLDATYDASAAAVVTLSGDKITSSSSAVGINGNQAILQQDGTYIFRGTLNDGMIVVNASETSKIQIVLDGVDITSKTYAAIYVIEADKVVVTLAEGSDNKLSSGESFTQLDSNNVDATVFSKADLTFNGAGKLHIESPAAHGIVSKDDLVFAGGTYTVNAAWRGIDANDSVRCAGTYLAVQSGKDAIRAKNDTDTTLGYVYINDAQMDISASGDGISASSNIQIDAGKFSIKAGVGVDLAANPNAPSAKSLKASGNLLVVNGEFNFESVEDTVNVNGNLILAAGKFDVKSGDDAFHADKNFYAVSAEVKVTECYEGIEAVNVEIRAGKIDITSKDDAINAAGGKDSTGTDDAFASATGSLKISGGETNINSNGDGFDVKGEFGMTGGLVRVSVSAKDGNSTYDYETGGDISGGVFIATGSSSVVSVPTATSQGVISVNAGSKEAGVEIKVEDESGTAVLIETPINDFEICIISTPKIVKGKIYKVFIGNDSGNFTAK